MALEEILLVVFSTGRIGLHIAATRAGSRVGLLSAGGYLLLLRIGDVIEPDEVVAVAPIGILLSRSLEPGTLAAGMACHEVEAHFNATLVSLIDECHQVAVGAETGIHLVIVDHVVAAIKPPRLEDGVQPEGIHTERLDVVEFRGDARQVADTVAIRIHIR